MKTLKKTTTVYERIFRHAVGREAKVVIRGHRLAGKREIFLEMEFLIRESHDADFHLPIELNHPQYWKLKRCTEEKAAYLQLEYSGVSRKELLETIHAFKSLFGPGMVFSYNIPITERIKSLKGIRVTAMSRRILSTF